MRAIALSFVLLLTLVGSSATLPALANSAIGDFFCDMFGCGSFGINYPECKMTEVRVDGTPSRHKFSFDQVCRGVNRAHVEAAYDLGTGRAEESIKSVSGAWSYRSRWNCASDPWIAPGEVTCANGKMSATGEPGYFDSAQLIYPTSAGSLSAQSRHVLAAQLQNVLNASPTPPPAPTPPDAPPTLVGPDLTVIRIDGPEALPVGQTGTYSFIVGNIGDVAASVEVNLLFVGALTQIGQVSADSGLGCAIGPGSGKVNINVGCSGGQLDPKRSATITVQAIGSAVGAGSVIASINNSRSLAEANYDNDLGRRDVAVN